MLCCRSKPFHNDIKVYSILKCNLLPLLLLSGRVNVFSCYRLSLLPLEAGVSFCFIFIISVKSICCLLVLKLSLTLLPTPWTTDCQAPLSRGFSSKNTGLGFMPSSGDLPHSGTKPDSLSLSHAGNPISLYSPIICHKCLSWKTPTIVKISSGKRSEKQEDSAEYFLIEIYLVQGSVQGHCPQATASPYCHLLYHLETKNGFYIFKQLHLNDYKKYICNVYFLLASTKLKIFIIQPSKVKC